MVLVYVSAVVLVAVPLDVVKWVVKFRQAGLVDASAVALVTLVAAEMDG